MILYLGDFPVGTTVPFPFPAYDANGASVTITGLATTDIEVYKGTSMTQRASDNGFALMDTDGIDIDSRTGIHGFSIDLSDNSDSGFYAAGSIYWVVVDSITVASQTVRFIYYFTIGMRLYPTTIGRTLDVSSGGEAGVDWANIGSPTTTVNLSGTTVKDATDVNTDTDALLSRLGTPSNLGGGATVAANLADIESQTDDIGAAGAGLTALATAAELAKVPKSDGTTTWNATALASINAEADTALADYDGPTNAEMVARTLASASYATAAAQTTAQNDLDLLTGSDGATLATSQPNYAPAKATDVVSGGAITTSGGAVSNVTTVATTTNLTNAPTNGDLTATMKASVNAEVVDALATDTYAEPSAVPAATSSLKDKINWVFSLLRNKRTQTATTETLLRDDGSTTTATSTKSDDGTTLTRGEWT